MRIPTIAMPMLMAAVRRRGADLCCTAAIMAMMPPFPTTVAYPDADIAAAVARALAAANDAPHPFEDTNRTPQKYARLALDFRNSAWKHLEDDDLPQASNKVGRWWPRR